jgi:ATP-binding cassette, subfamily B, bacterial PglK
MLKTLQQCWLLAPSRLKRPWWLLVILSLVNAMLEIAAAAAMVILFAHLAGSAVPRIPLIRDFIAVKDLQTPSGVLSLCAILAALFTLKYGVASLIAVLQIRLPLTAGNDLAGRLFQLYLAAPYEFHLRRNSAETIRNLVASVDVLFRVVVPSTLAIFSESISVAAILTLLLASAPVESLVIGVVASGLLVGFYLLFHRRLLFWGQRVQDLTRDGLMHARQSIDGIKEIRIFGREQFFWNRYMEARGGLSRTLIRQAELQQLPKVLLEAFFIALVLGAIVLFNLRSDRADILPLLGLFAYGGLRILPSVGRILISLQLIRSGGAASAAVFRDYSQLQRRAEAVNTVATAPSLRSNIEIEIERVTLHYKSATRPALLDISVNMRQGEATAFVGLSGAGKSTLVNVLLGLLTPQSGAIRFRGSDVRDDLRRWQSRIGYVPQTIFLLDDTLRRNVAFGVPDSDIDEDRVRQALELAQLSDLLRGLPDDLDARLGEQGARLSGGERQRVAIARALYGDPEVVVFDEATSSIDGVTGRYISDAIERMRGKRTVIIVTHQLDLARSCDRVVLLEKGQIVAEGTFHQVARGNAWLQGRADVDRPSDVNSKTVA